MKRVIITLMITVLLATVVTLCGCGIFTSPADENYQQYIDDPENQEVVPDQDGVLEPDKE